MYDIIIKNGEIKKIFLNIFIGGVFFQAFAADFRTYSSTMPSRICVPWKQPDIKCDVPWSNNHTMPRIYEESPMPSTDNISQISGPLDDQRMPSRGFNFNREIAFILKLRELQKNGDKIGLQKEIERIQSLKIIFGKAKKLEIAESILNEPITDILSTVKNGTPEQAQAAIRRIYALSPYKYRRASKDSHSDQKMFVEKQAFYRDKYTYDVLEEAKKLYGNREYVPWTSEYPMAIRYSSLIQQDPYLVWQETCDFMMTPVPNCIAISPEIDAGIMERIKQLSADSVYNLNTLSHEAGSTLFDMHHIMTCEPQNTQDFSQRIEKLYAIVSKIAKEDIPYFCMRAAASFGNRIADPVGIIGDQLRGVYGIAKYFCDINFGSYYMTEKQQLEYLESSIKNFTNFVEGLKCVQRDQIADLTGLIAADLTFNLGAGKAISFVKEIGVINKANRAVCKMAKSLEKALCTQAEHQLITPEGVAINCTRDVNNEISSVKKIQKSLPIEPSEKVQKIGLHEKEVFKFAYLENQKYAHEFEKIGLKPISKGSLKHIINSHMPDGEKAVVGKKSVFNKGENIIKMALEVWEKGYSSEVNAKRYDMGRIIGKNINGNPTQYVEIFLNGEGNAIRTMYPV